MHTGFSAGHPPQSSIPPQPSSSDPHCAPAPLHPVGWQSVVVDAGPVDVVTIVEVLATSVLIGLEVVGVTTGVAPHRGGVGSTADLHVVVAALRFAAHVERQTLPALRFGHAALQLVSSSPMGFLHGLGHRWAITVGLNSSTIAIETARRTRHPRHGHASSWPSVIEYACRPLGV